MPRSWGLTSAAVCYNTYNGSRIFDARTGELLYEKNLTAEQSTRIIDVAEKYNVPITTYKGDTAITDNADDKYFLS